jgi:hypothetical protein
MATSDEVRHIALRVGDDLPFEISSGHCLSLGLGLCRQCRAWWTICGVSPSTHAAEFRHNAIRCSMYRDAMLRNCSGGTLQLRGDRPQLRSSGAAHNVLFAGPWGLRISRPKHWSQPQTPRGTGHATRHNTEHTSLPWLAHKSTDESKPPISTTRCPRIAPPATHHIPQSNHQGMRLVEWKHALVVSVRRL